MTDPLTVDYDTPVVAEPEFTDADDRAAWDQMTPEERAEWLEIEREIDGQLDEAQEQLQEAFNVNQPRFPKGHAKAGQWRPKLVTGAGGLAPGHLERDIAKLAAAIEETKQYKTVPQRDLDAFGKQVEHIALKYSARKTYEKRLADIRAERKTIQDAKWDAYEKAWRAASQAEADAMEPEQFIDPKSAARLKEIAEEEIKLVKQRDHADIDAMLGVLQKIRPMGGRLKTAPASENKIDPAGGYTIEAEYRQQELERQAGAKVLMQRDLEASLKQVLKLIPKEWLDDTNKKGTTSFLFSKERAWADTRQEGTGPRDEWAKARGEFDRMVAAGYEFLGTDRKYPNFLAMRDPATGHIVALRNDGTMVTGVGSFESTPLALSKEGQWVLPRVDLRFEPASEADVKKYIEPMKTIPPERQRPGGAMGPDWDAYKEMRDAVKAREKEGWKFVGMRGRWATLRKGSEEVSLNWAGEPLTRQIGPPDKRDLPPLNPHTTIPLPPLPSRTNTQIKIDPRVKHTLLHELCHRLEVVYGEENRAGYNPISMATHGFLTSRTQGEELQKLKDLYPGYAYEDHELARPDKFVDAYVGKSYSGQATEVLTMGMEMLFYPRAGRDINDDPGHRRLILGLLAAL